MVDMGIIESMDSQKGKRRLRSIDGAFLDQPRYFGLTSEYKDDILYPKLVERKKIDPNESDPDQFWINFGSP